MPKKPQIPLLVKDVFRMREHLNIEATGRVRVILQTGDRKLGVLLECFCCEELLEWAAGKWWVCPVCGDQTTEEEARDLLITCSEGLKVILGEVDGGASTDESTDEGTDGADEGVKDEGPRSGRWVDRVRRLMGS